MRAISIAVAGVSVALIALTLVPAAGEYRPYFAVAALVSAAIVLFTIVSGWRESPAAGVVPPAVQQTAPPPVVPSAPVKARPLPVTNESAGSDVVAFLAGLQERGRFVDFIQDDITSYTDAQVGAAARVVHAGCKAVFEAQLRIVPVREEHEGAKVSVAPGYAADEYRFVGKISGQAPFSGTLMHRGWKAESVNLPRALRPDDGRLPTIAPAEVELR